jgi:hypothetical protein
MFSLNNMRPFGANPIIKPCRLGPKRTKTYNLGWGVIDMKYVGKLEMVLSIRITLPLLEHSQWKSQMLLKNPYIGLAKKCKMDISLEEPKKKKKAKCISTFQGSHFIFYCFSHLFSLFPKTFSIFPNKE